MAQSLRHTPPPPCTNQVCRHTPIPSGSGSDRRILATAVAKLRRLSGIVHDHYRPGIVFSKSECGDVFSHFIRFRFDGEGVGGGSGCSISRPTPQLGHSAPTRDTTNAAKFILTLKSVPFQGYGPISRHSNLKLRSPVNQKGRNWRTLPSI